MSLPEAGVPTRCWWLSVRGDVRRLVSASYLVLMTWALLAPAATFETIDEAFRYQDKVAHGLVFLALAFLVRWALPGAWGGGPRRVAVLVALACYAVSTEVLQGLLTASQRTFEWEDMGFNVAGLCAGWLLFAAALAGGKGIPPRREVEPAEDATRTGRRAVR